MAEIFHYHNERASRSSTLQMMLGSGRWACKIESSNESFPYYVEKLQTGQTYVVSLDGKKIITVKNCNVIVHGEVYSSIRTLPNGFLLSNGVKLDRVFGRSYTLNGVEVAKITRGGDLFHSIFDFIKRREWQKPKPYSKIEFDASVISQLEALVLLLAEPEAEAST